MIRIATVAAVLLLAMPLAPAHAAEDWRYGLAADIAHDDNASRGLYDGKKSDTIAAVEGSASRSLLLSPQSGALFRASYLHRFQ